VISYIRVLSLIRVSVYSLSDVTYGFDLPLDQCVAVIKPKKTNKPTKP
jgi:hypothetical protein